MSYTVLARRYRSRSFDELVGQESIARTLQNAIGMERTAHAYLFCGTRGVGKTSLARIFAKALNVTSELEQADAIAEAILRGEDLDVIEIDGASNRGIQEARDLIAGAGLSPARCRYKIYIIDEVHALTKDAFNALLKTMEEPPSHVKFILCTTDPQKVPATIQSRCQRFDFRSIPTALIATQLDSILAQENIRAEEGVTGVVARLGNGSMRDALSLLDRLIAAAEDVLTLERAEEILGLPDHSLIEALVAAMIASDPKAALEGGAELLARGSTVDQALEMLAEHLRTLLVVAACGGDSELVEGTAETLAAAKEQAEHFDVPALVYMIAVCDATARNARGSATSRALFDAALVRLCLAEHFADVSGLATVASGKKKGSEPAIAAGGVSGAVVEMKRGAVPATTRAPASVATPIARADHAPRRETSSSDVETGSAQPAPSEPVPSEPVPSEPLSPDPSSSDPSSSDPSSSDPSSSDPGPPRDEDLWPAVLSFAAATPADASKVRPLEFRSFDGQMLRLCVEASSAASAPFLLRRTDAIADLVKRATDRRVRVEIEPPAPDRTAPAAPSPAARSAEIEAARKLPLVQRAIELFDASITDVRPQEGLADV